MTPAQREQEVGIGCYATTGGPCRGRAKSSAEEFFVVEQIRKGGISQEDRRGWFPLYRVEKRSVDTLHMARELGAALKSRVSYAGLKDKRAVAVQYVTPTSLRSERPHQVAREGFVAAIIGYVSSPVTRGALIGNRYNIVLRDCCPENDSRVGEVMELAQKRRIPNFYGLQRFGTFGAGTHRIGRALVKAEFEEAVTLMLLSDNPSDAGAGRASKEAFASGRYAEGEQLLPPGKDVEKLVAREAGRHPGQWVRALRAVPLTLRRLYVHAYQSFIFNRALSRAVIEGEDISELKMGDNWAATSDGGLTTLAPRGVRDVPSEGAVPMVQVVGYAFRNYGSRFDRILQGILAEEGVAPAEFYVKEMQEVSSEGGFRRPHIALGGASWKTEEGNAMLEFTLGRGQYATILLREMVKPSDPGGAGLA